jgi:flavin reductase (DIM6/NTAB) family NADH-FMN oxidoreductase RutF
MGKLYWKPGNMLYPLPVVMVSVRDKDIDNIITVAWAGTINSDPAMLSISVRKERFSYEMLKNSGEFVVNLVTKDLAYACDYCGVASGRDVDKFRKMNLTKLESKYVNAPSIKESPVNLECKIEYTQELGTHTIFMAKILGVTVDDRYMDESGRFNLNDSNLVTYSHGRYYTLGEELGKFGYSVKKK